jgi:flagellar biogenesis protein FliO
MAFLSAFARRTRTAVVVLLACLCCLPSPCGMRAAGARAADVEGAVPVAPSPETPAPMASPPAKLLEPVTLDRTLDPSPAAPSRAGSQPLVNWGLLGVIAAAFGVLAVLKVAGKRRMPALPPDVFDVLGSGSLGGQHSVRIVRFGPKTLLVSVSATGCHTLAELTDPQATACVAAACRGVHPPLRPRATSQAAGRASAAPVRHPGAEQGVA